MQNATGAAGAMADPVATTTVWEQLANRLSPGYEWSKVCDGLVASRFATRHGDTYYIVKNPGAGTYVRLAADEYFLLGLMDGSRQVKDLVLAYFQQYKRLALRRIIHVVEQLRQHRFLTEAPRDVWRDLSERCARRNWLTRVDGVLRAFISREFAVRGIDRLVSSAYRAVGWIFFTRLGAALLALLAAAGVVLFGWELLHTGRDPLRVHDSAALGAISLVALSLFMLWVHESGHALATKAYGRDVNRGGFMIYYGMPAFFVDTTDIWLEPRRARMIVSAAGMIAVWALGGLAMLFLAAEPGSALAPIAFQLAFVCMVDNSFNLLPLIELDGYYLLMDWLELPLLRARALAFVRRDLLRKLRQRQPFNREERIFAVFGSLAMLCSVFILAWAVYFWVSSVRRVLMDVWASESPLLSALVVLILAVIILPLIFGLLVKLGLWLRKTGGGVAYLRHRQEAAQARTRLDARELLGKLRFLRGLSPRQREEIATKLQLRRYRAGEYVVREAEPGEEFYLIREGQAEVLKLDAGGWPRRLVVLRRGDYFGELALLREQARLASVRALSKLEVYAFGRHAFETDIAPQLRDYGLTVRLLDERVELSRMSIVRDMPPSELDPILERLVAEEVTEGTCIIRQGDPGDRFYLIRRGRVEVEQADEAGRIQTIAKLGTGDYFGERALVDDAPRAATVRALEPVSLWSLDRTGFQDLLLGQMRLRHSLSPAADRCETRGRLAGDETTG